MCNFSQINFLIVCVFSNVFHKKEKLFKFQMFLQLHYFLIFPFFIVKNSMYINEYIRVLHV